MIIATFGDPQYTSMSWDGDVGRYEYGDTPHLVRLSFQDRVNPGNWPSESRAMVPKTGGTYAQRVLRGREYAKRATDWANRYMSGPGAYASCDRDARAVAYEYYSMAKALRTQTKWWLVDPLRKDLNKALAVLGALENFTVTDCRRRA